jgi:hypothetical protein
VADFAEAADLNEPVAAVAGEIPSAFVDWIDISVG